MNATKLLSLLMLGAVFCVTSASANYFGNSRTGTNLNIGSAPNAVRQFIVFFDLDKSDLTPEAQHIVSEAVKVAKEIGSVRIVVTGHADNAGSARYTQRLSERRALAIKVEMVQLGMSDTDIVILGKGFSEPLIPMGEGTREPQNRRAVIDLGNGPVAMLSN